MGWPQYTYLGLIALGLGFAIAKDGEPKEGNHSFIGSLIAAAISVWILYVGGFFG